MPNFWDLPRPVRDKIYRLHLVHDKAIDPDAHARFGRIPGKPYLTKVMPALLRVSDRSDREAAPIYYGENRFDFSNTHVHVFTYSTMPRHARQMQRITCDWNPLATGISYGLEAVGRLKGLKEFNLRVDEKEMVNKSLRSRGIRQHWADDHDPSAQEHLAIYQLPGMNALLALSDIPVVNFLKRLDKHNKEFGGPIPGGVLLTHVLPKITAKKAEKKSKGKRNAAKAPKPKKSREGKQDHFDFLALPAEVRNRIYELLLGIEGPIHPSKAPPSSVSRRTKRDKPVPESALSLLGVNKQIYDEAAGIFYAVPLVFYYPTQLAAFIADLGGYRQRLIKDVTVHYDNTKRGGIELADVCFSLLRALTGLQRLRIIMQADLFNKIQPRRWGSSGWYMDHANPAMIPGMKVLFSLRGIADVKVRDVELKKHFEEALKEKEHPNFEAQSRSYHIVKLAEALRHFNEALLVAQSGSINPELLKDNKWHTWDEFPKLLEEENAIDVEEESPVGEEKTTQQGEAPGQVEDLDQWNGGNSKPSIVAPNATRAPIVRRSARLSARFDQAQMEQQQNVDVEDAGEEPHILNEADDIGKDFVIHQNGPDASPEA